MAQQFVLKGVKDLRDYSSTDGTFTFQIKQDPRGGDTFQIPQWWAKKANNVIYNSCTVFDLVGTTYNMIIPTSADTQLQVTYDDDVYNLVLSNFNAVERVAITDKSTRKLVMEYVMPANPSGVVAKRVYQEAATIGAVDISGKGNVDAGGTAQYKSNVTSQVSDLVFQWEIFDGGTTDATSTTEAQITAGATESGCTVSWKQAGSYDLKCTVTSATAADSPQEDTKSVTATVVPTVGTATITGAASVEATKSTSYTASVSGNNVNDLEYQWSVLNADAQITAPNAASTNISFDKEGNATVKCVVSSPSTTDSSSPTKEVTITTAKVIGNVTITADETTIQATVADNFQAGYTGNIVDATYQWTVSPDDGTYAIASATAEATNITFNAAGSYEVRCKITSATANDSPSTSAPTTVTVTGIPSMPGVTLGGPQTIDALGVGRNYTSTTSDGSTLSGTTTYQWTAQDEDTGETTGIGVTIETPTAQNTKVTYTTNSEDRTVALRCKWTNAAYADSPKTGKRAVTIDTVTE